jgi:hypothetical protein
VDTAIAFGRACGLEAKWLNNLFRFARKPSERHVVNARPRASRSMAGFVEFGCAQLEPAGRELAARTRRHLRARAGSGRGHLGRVR